MSDPKRNSLLKDADKAPAPALARTAKVPMVTSRHSAQLAGDERAYRYLVEGFAESKSKEIFSNGRAEHAAIIFETFLKYAKCRVNFFCHNMSNVVFGRQSLIERLEMALIKGVKVSIITQEEPEATQLDAQIKEWKKNPKMDIELVRAKGDAAIATTNFATMDARAYRFEPDRNKPEAWACMNAPASAKVLEDKFLRFMAATV